MRRIAVATLLLGMLQANYAHGQNQHTSPSNGVRTTVALNEGWRFHSGEVPHGDPVDVADADWQVVRVPHDFSIVGPFRKDNPAGGDGGFLPTGIGWYRCDLSIPDTFRGKRVYVEFDGVMANSDVWINGEHLGHRPNGYVSFRYDLTDHLTYGDQAQNVLSVRADTSQQKASRWYTGSGIYRNVRLVVVDPVHIEHDGVFISTPTVSAESADVHASIEVKNELSEGVNAVVRVDVMGPDGQQVDSGTAEITLEPQAVAEVELDFTVATPERWSIKTPLLYTAVSQVIVQGEAVDQTKTRFGIRTAEFRADTGFWLNDDNLKIKGVCLHHDGGPFGAAVPASVWRDRFAKLKSLGVNAVRTAHNPPDPVLLDLCDQMGLVVMDEFFDCWTVGKRTYDYHRYFEEWWRRDLVDTVRRDRNHPSVVLYSVGNEIRDTHQPDLAHRILSGLVDACHQTDPTRPATQALFRPNVTHDYDNGLADLLDVVGTNYRDAELLQAWRDKPTRKIIGTEQGHDRSTWLACRDHRQHAGQFLWVGVDYLGESRRWPVTTFNAGLIDRVGYTYPRGYERASWWSDTPMVHAFRRIAATEATPTDPGYEQVEWQRRQVLFDDWSPRSIEPHREQVEVYSNCDEVELLLNGQSLGAQSLPANASPRKWDVDFVAGELVAIGRDDGQEVARHLLNTAGRARGIRATTNRERLPSGWDEIAIVEAQFVDGDGVAVPRGVAVVEFDVTGPGEVVAVDNGSIISHEPFQVSHRSAFQGRCFAMVRRFDSGGPIRVTARSEGLAPASIDLPATE